MTLLGPGRVSMGLPDLVGSILAEYGPEPTHLDLIHCPNRGFLVLIFSTNPHFGQIIFDLSRQRWLFRIF